MQGLHLDSVALSPTSWLKEELVSPLSCRTATAILFHWPLNLDLNKGDLAAGSIWTTICIHLNVVLWHLAFFFFYVQPSLWFYLVDMLAENFTSLKKKNFQFLKVPLLLHKDLKSHSCSVKLKKLDIWEMEIGGPTSRMRSKSVKSFHK